MLIKSYFPARLHMNNIKYNLSLSLKRFMILGIGRSLQIHDMNYQIKMYFD